VIGVDVDSGHRMRWLLHRKGVPLYGVYCPFVGLGWPILRCEHNAVALYLGFGTLQFSGSLRVNDPFWVPCARLSPDY
jgi:hypothetical protein